MAQPNLVNSQAPPNWCTAAEASDFPTLDITNMAEEA